MLILVDLKTRTEATLRKQGVDEEEEAGGAVVVAFGVDGAEVGHHLSCCCSIAEHKQSRSVEVAVDVAGSVVEGALPMPMDMPRHRATFQLTPPRHPMDGPNKSNSPIRLKHLLTTAGRQRLMERIQPRRTRNLVDGARPLRRLKARKRTTSRLLEGSAMHRPQKRSRRHQKSLNPAHQSQR